MQRLRDLIAGDELILAPVALSPIMALQAQDIGFKAIYMSGGSLGWVKCVAEANLTLPEMAAVALDIRTVTDIPMVLDAGGGWGDPAHIHRTVTMSEAAGFDAIEIEDQFLPRRFHHHIGEERLVDADFMVQRIAEAVAARTNPDTLIIGRTNALRPYDMDEALRRGEAYRQAGADMIFIHSRTPEEIRTIGERLPAPLMIFAPPDGFATFEMSRADLFGLGYRLVASSGSAFAAQHKATRQSYEAFFNDTENPYFEPGEVQKEMKLAHKSARLERFLDIEKRTMDYD